MLCIKGDKVINLATVRAQRAQGNGPRILAVGDVTGWQRSGGDLPVSSHLALADFHEVSGGLLDDLRPDFVISPAICRQFDCLDLAQVLYSNGFDGLYRAQIGLLPAPAMIRREVLAHYPGLDFDFLDLAQMRQTAII